MNKNTKISNNPTGLGMGDLLGLIGAAAITLAIWLLASHVFDVPHYLLPSPSDVAHRASQEFARLATDFLVTGTEALIGFILSSVFSVLIAIQLTMRQDTEQYVMPALVVVKSVPIVALAPLVGYWFGYGYAGKIFMAALISFFPLVINTVSGMRAASREQVDFFKVMGATKWDEVTRLRLPRALPHIFSAMRIAAPLAVVGAVVAEMLGARHGLGFTLAVSSMTLDIPLNFAAMLASALLGIVSFYAILLCERRVLHHFRLSSEQSW